MSAAGERIREALPSLDGHEEDCPCSVGRVHADLARLERVVAAARDEDLWYAIARLIEQTLPVGHSAVLASKRLRAALRALDEGEA